MSAESMFAAAQFAHTGATSTSSGGGARSVLITANSRIVAEQSLPFHRKLRVTGRSKIVRNNLI